MADGADLFAAATAEATVAALIADPRPALVFDRSATTLVWANAAGAAYMDCRTVGDLAARSFSPAHPGIRRIAALFQSLSGSQERVERLPLPRGMVPRPVVCRVRRVTLSGEKNLLLLVADGTGTLAGDPVAAFHAFAGTAAPQAEVLSPEPADLTPEIAPEITLPGDDALLAGPPVEPDLTGEDIAAPADILSFPAAPEGDIAPEPLAAEVEEPVGSVDTDQPVLPETRIAAALETGDDSLAAPVIEPVAEPVPEPVPEPVIAAVPDVVTDDPDSDAEAEVTDLHAAPDPAPLADLPSEDSLTTRTDAETDSAPQGFVFPEHGRAIRFVFELDQALAFRFVSEELAVTVGPRAADVVGRSWPALSAELGIDPRQRVAGAIDRRDTFTGLTVDWPIENAALRVPVDLAGMPVFGRNRQFGGYRGFGVIKTGAAFAADAVDFDGLRPAAVETVVEDSEAVIPPSPVDESVPVEAVVVEAVPVESAVVEAVPVIESAAAEPLPVEAVAAEPDITYAAPADIAPELLAETLPEPVAVPDPDDDFQVFEAAPIEVDLVEPEPEDLAFVAPVVDDIPAPDEIPADEISTAETPADEPPPAEAESAEVDVVWSEQPTMIIPAPVIARPVPQQPADVFTPEVRRGNLSKPERDAFDKIAAALATTFGPGGERRLSTAALGLSGTTLPLVDLEDEIDAPAVTDAAPETETDTPAAEPAASLPDPAPALPAPLLPAMLDIALVDKLPVALALLKDGDLLHVNRAFLDLAGFADLAELQAAGGFPSVFEGSALPREAAIPAIRRKDGVEIPVSAKLHSLPLGDGVASLLVLQETAATTSRDRLLYAEQRVEDLEAILDTATDGVLVLDHKGLVIGANRSAEALFGIDRSSMLGTPMIDLLAPESHRGALDYLDGLTRNGLSSVLNDGREVIGRVQGGGLVPLFMTIGRVSHTKLCAVLRDITQWKRAEEELTAAKRSAETASSQKSDFLAKMSHEIRTPLNAIIGFSEVMMEERFGAVGNERYKEYLRDIHMSGTHIMSLVNDLLDLSKIEAGKLELNFEAVGLNDVVRECAALMQPQANRERIIIRTSLSSSLPAVVADSRSLRQIVLNLLSNAVKFNTAGGQVIVSTLYEETGEVVLRVRDTGLGMSEQDVGKALEPFRQLHTTRTGQGTGLGLPLTKALVEANRAAFRIDSTVGQGTLIQVTFPSTRVLAE